MSRSDYCLASCFFFFSSRRRHTRCSRDWSSDVCSSDLEAPPIGEPLEGPLPAFPRAGGRLLADVSAEVGGQRYFAPLITNASASDITLEVNPATAAAVRCNCFVSKSAVRTHIGYYRL